MSIIVFLKKKDFSIKIQKIVNTIFEIPGNWFWIVLVCWCVLCRVDDTIISQKQKVTMADITSAGILVTCLDESCPFQLGLASFKILDFYNSPKFADITSGLIKILVSILSSGS